MIKASSRWCQALMLVALWSPSLLSQETIVHGRLEEKEGQRLLCLWGTPEERGFAEGYLQAEAIQVGLSPTGRGLW